MISLSPTPVLTTERLTLRAPAGGDWPLWDAFFRSDRAIHVGGGPDIDERLSWRAFGHVIGHWVMRGYGSFVFTRKGDDTALGMSGPWFPAGWPEPEIGWTVWQADLEGKGFAYEAASGARDYAREALGWSNMVSYIDPKNARSIALAERLGAVRDDAASAPVFDTPSLIYRHPKEAA